MNLIRSSILLQLSFFLCTNSFAQTTPQRHDLELHLNKSITGKVIKPVDIRVKLSRDGEKRHLVKSAGKWVQGNCHSEGPGGLHALLADLNFDGKADLWITGYTDPQGRVRCSDVWLFNAQQNKYIYNAQISAIPNLEVAAKEKMIFGGISNCGCAASCYFEDDYIWVTPNKLKKIARRANNCEQYSEYSLVNGSLQKTPQIKINQNKSKPKNYHLLDWSKTEGLFPNTD